MFYNKQIFERCFWWPARYWYENVKQIPLYFRAISYLVRNGYDKYALWGTCDWFITTMRSILQEYRRSHRGYPILIDNYPPNSTDKDEQSKRLREENDKMWDDIIDHMIELLDLMDESNPKYEADSYHTSKGIDKQWEEMSAAKNEFFELFSKHFFDLWD